MKILNTSGEEITSPDLSQGYLEESLYTSIISAIPAQSHNWISGIFFSDGSAYYPREDDPNNHIEIIDVPEQPEQKITEKVLIYHPYNELELTNQDNINDILLLIADLVGGEEEIIEEDNQPIEDQPIEDQ